MKKFEKLSKRTLALFLSLVMCLGMLPGTALAAEGDSLNPDPVSDDKDNPTVTISKTAKRTGANTWEVTMTVTTAGEQIQTQPMELVILMDDSGSMTFCTEDHRHSNSCGYTCGKEYHQHTGRTGSCYELVCTQEKNPSHWEWWGSSLGYVHKQSYDNRYKDCYKLICEKERHTHENCAYACGKDEHAHSSNWAAMDDSVTNPNKGGDYRKSRQYIAGTQAQALVDRLCSMGLNAKISVVTFPNGGSARLGLTDLTQENLATIKGQLYTYVDASGKIIPGQSHASGSTPMTSGLNVANDQFTGNGQKVIVMLADGDTSNKNSVDTAKTMRENGVQIYTIGFATAGDAAKTLIGVAGSEDRYYQAANTLELANAFTTIAAQLSAMVQDDMGTQVKVSGEATVKATDEDGKEIVTDDPDPTVTGGALKWDADGNKIPAKQTRTITYTVELDTTLNADGSSKIAVGSNTPVKLNGTAVLNYKVGEDGESQSLAFPLPTDTVDYGTLDQTFVTTDGTALVLSTEQTSVQHQGLAKWEEGDEGLSFTATKPAQELTGEDGKTYNYVKSIFTDKDGNPILGSDGQPVQVQWTGNTVSVENNCTAQYIKHIYSLGYMVSYSWDLPEGTYYGTAEENAEPLTGEDAPVVPDEQGPYETGTTYNVDSAYTSASVLYTRTANEHLEGTSYVSGKYSFSGWKLNGEGAPVTGQQTIATSNVEYKGTWTKESENPNPEPPEPPIPGVSKYGVTYEVKYAEGVTEEQQSSAPERVKSTLGNKPTDSTKYFVGQEVAVADVYANVTTESNGTWVFSGWKLAGDTTEYGRENTGYVAMAASGLAFVGEWSFTPDPVPGFTIVKTAEVDHKDQCTGDSAHVGDVINYTITVTNTGTMGLTDISITDTMSGNRMPDAGSLKVDGVPYTGALNFGLGVGCSTVVTYTYTVKETDKGDTITNAVTSSDAGYDPTKSTPETETEVDRPNIASAKKTAVVKDQEIPAAVAMVVDGRIVYPDVNGKIEAKGGDTVTLLYAVELRGEVGAAFNVEEEADAVFVGSTLKQEVRMTRSYPAQYVGVLEHETDTLYFTRTFVIEADPDDPGQGKPLTNAITVAGLAPDEDDTATTDVELLYAVRYKYSQYGYVPANAIPGKEVAKKIGDDWGFLTDEGYAEKFYKVGDPVEVADPAVAEGYTFSGWMTADVEAFWKPAEERPETFFMPANDVVFTGSFTANGPETTTYTVQYYKQTLTSDEYVMVEADTETRTETAGALVTVIPKGNKYEGFQYNADKSEIGESEIKADGSTVFKVYYDRRSFNVSYAYLETAPEGATDLTAGDYAQSSYKYGETVKIAAAAAAPGYRFIGWALPNELPYTNENETDFEMPAEDVVLTGWFIEQQHNISYTVEHLVVGDRNCFASDTVEANSVGVSQTKLEVTAGSIQPKTGYPGVGHFIYMDTRVSAGDMVDNGTIIRLFYAPESWNWPSNPSVIVNKTLADGQAAEVDVGARVTWTVTVMNDSDVPYTGGLELREMLAGTTVTGYYAIWNAYAREELPGEPPITPPGDEEGQEAPEISIPEDPAVPEDPGDPVVPEEPEGPVVPELPETPVVPEEPVDVVTRSILFHAQGDAVADLSDFDLYPGEMIVFTITKEILPEDGTNLVNTVAIYWNGEENADPETPIGTGTSVPVTVRRYEVNFYMDETMAEQLEGSRSDYCLGDPLTAPVLTTRPGEGGTWVFAGWDHAVSGTVTRNDDYYALWRFEADVVPDPVYYPVTYTVSGQIPDGYTAPGTVEEVVSGGYHTVLSAPGDRRGIRDGVVGTYEFNGWSVPAGTAVQVNGPVWITGVWAFVADEPRLGPPEPTIPTPTPTPPDNDLTIEDEEVPLANAVGLNDTDHFAYIIGYDDDTVQPLGEITRAEVATIFFRLMTDVYRSANWSTVNSFNDVKAGSWYNNAISTCANAGALKGYEDGTFQPNKKITRAEFAAIAARFLSDEITDDGVGDFSDTKGHWAAKEIRLAAKAGWVQGSGNRFEPDKYITRAEVMTIVNRMLDRVPDAEHMLPAMKKWVDNPEGTWYYEAVQEATNEHDYERDETGVVETWLELLAIRDWKALEAEWANNGGMTVPTQPAETESGGTENP